MDVAELLIKRHLKLIGEFEFDAMPLSLLEEKEGQLSHPRFCTAESHSHALCPLHRRTFLPGNSRMSMLKNHSFPPEFQYNTSPSVSVSEIPDCCGSFVSCFSE
jgi:hypothetical protein